MAGHSTCLVPQLRRLCTLTRGVWLASSARSRTSRWEAGQGQLSIRCGTSGTSKKGGGLECQPSHCCVTHADSEGSDLCQRSPA
eukprot:UN2478